MAIRLAHRCDGTGGAEEIDPQGQTAAQLSQGEGFVWLHLERPAPDEPDWLHQSGLDALVTEVLDAPETRPRCATHGDGVLMNLRGVNLSEGAEPEDMVSLRIWATQGLVVTVQRRRIRAVEDVAEALTRRAAPQDSGELIARIALRLADRAEPIVADLNERIDDLETELEDNGRVPSRAELAEVRRVSIMLRRYMFPQRDALSTLEIEDMDWMMHGARERVREATERVTRLAESLDAIRDRAEVVHDQIMDMRAEASNRQMLVLSVVAAIFLPLGLLTGLLGINVGGVPGAAQPMAFWVVCALLLVIGAGQVWLFRHLGLIGRDRG
ncbi:zinc transporter ZntB [Arenibacterium halophilum]|uniref:Zinc transporter ZntB n=1 Tax=Arenibacterium halophilum TaxID=2583821 RepID=A0ABY2XDN5_9RHOB|nr:zinc transporter ZntB [Arenibacterium halophilum]TMV15089.1 zinc transporter ZntB [Arenibacterium halophilum]